MAYTATITLSSAGAGTGPFNLFSNIDGYATAFATNVAKSSLLSGYSSTAVPDGTTIIRVTSAGTCTNSVDLTVSGAPSLTATLQYNFSYQNDSSDMMYVYKNGSAIATLSLPTGILSTTINNGDDIYARVISPSCGDAHVDFYLNGVYNTSFYNKCDVESTIYDAVAGNTYRFEGYTGLL